APAAETCAVDRGDFDLRQFRKAMQRLLSESRVLLRLLDVRGDGEFAHVGAGDEDAGLRRGDDDFLDVAGALELIDNRRELLHHPRREFVHFLAGKIEPENGEIAVALDAERARGGGVLRRRFSGGGHALPRSRSSSSPSSAYISSMSGLYRLSTTLRFPFSHGVTSSLSIVKSLDRKSVV